MRLSRGLQRGYDQIGKNSLIVVFLDTTIKQLTAGTVFDELRTATAALITKNTMAVGASLSDTGLAINGEMFHPTMIKEITNIPYGSEIMYLTLHKSMVKEFNEYITKYRDTLTKYAAIRNLIFQALRTSNSLEGFMALIGLPNAEPPQAMATAYRSLQNSSRPDIVHEETIQEFTKKYAQSIKTFEDFMVINSLFGDVL